MFQAKCPLRLSLCSGSVHPPQAATVNAIRLDRRPEPWLRQRYVQRLIPGRDSGDLSIGLQHANSMMRHD